MAVWLLFSSMLLAVALLRHVNDVQSALRCKCTVVPVIMLLTQVIHRLRKVMPIIAGRAASNYQISVT